MTGGNGMINTLRTNMHDNTTKATINLLNENKMYVVKQGKLIEHELPDYGETMVVTHNGRVERLETLTKKKV